MLTARHGTPVRSQTAVQAFLTKIRSRTALAVASPLAGAYFAGYLFDAIPEDPVGTALIAGAIFVFSMILGIGFSIDALEMGERPRWAAIMALVANGAVVIGCVVAAISA
jgi:peptidoglycan/LPS O-acetylase OafA/YrhL